MSHCSHPILELCFLLLVIPGALGEVKLRIAQAKVDWFHLREVRAWYYYGGEIAPASASTLGPLEPGHTVEMAIDNDLTTMFYSDTGTPGNWLLITYPTGVTATDFTFITVYNREDCCGHRAEGSIITLEEDGEIIWQGELSGSPQQYDFDLSTTSTTSTSTATTVTATVTTITATTVTSSSSLTTSSTSTSLTSSATSLSSTTSSTSISSTSTATTSTTLSTSSTATTSTTLSTSSTTSRTSTEATTLSSSTTTSTGTTITISSSTTFRTFSTTTTSSTKSSTRSTTQYSTLFFSTKGQTATGTSIPQATSTTSRSTTQASSFVPVSSGMTASTTEARMASTSTGLRMMTGMDATSSSGTSKTSVALTSSPTTVVDGVRATSEDAGIGLAALGLVVTTTTDVETEFAGFEIPTTTSSDGTAAKLELQGGVADFDVAEAGQNVTLVPSSKPMVVGVAEHVAVSAAADIVGFLREGLRQLQQESITNASVHTDVGQVFIYNLSAVLKEQGESVFVTALSATVHVPNEFTDHLSLGTVLTVLSVERKNTTASAGGMEEFQDVAEAEGTLLATPVVDISLYKYATEEYEPVSLETPLLFRLPGQAEAPNGVVCAFLDLQAVVPRWSTRGVWRATDEEVRAVGGEVEGIWCWTSHLSIFAGILDIAMGCTNMELFTPEAISAIRENEHWHKASSALIVFVLFLVLLCVWSAGLLWELWMLRFGRTYDSRQRVSLCRNIVLWGPQVLKHKYAAFVLYCRDVAQCLSARRKRLQFKTSTLTAAVQRFLAVRTGISTACVATHLWNGGGWIESKASIPYTVLCHKLEFHAGAAESVMVDLCGRGVLASVRRFFLTVIALHPVLDAMRVGAGSMSVGKRIGLQVCGIFGVLATNALIFHFSGSQRSWQADVACPISPHSDFYIIVATVVSVAINAVPNAFMMNFAKQIYRRPGWTLLFWALMYLYLLLTAMTVVIALANLNTYDQYTWYKALEWSMTIKLVLMPVAQGMRHTIMVEVFLKEDANAEPSQQFRCVMGLKHPSEKRLSMQEFETVQVWAKQAISTTELVKFAALLGDKVMPEFDPATTTSEDVINRAITPLCIKPPALEDFPVQVEIVEGWGLPAPQEIHKSSGHLSCSILHLGRQDSHERPCIQEYKSSAVDATLNRCDRSCHWAHSISINGLQMEEAIGFTVKELGRNIGIALLPAEELIKGEDWCGELILSPPEGTNASFSQTRSRGESGDSSITVPSQASSVPSSDIMASHGLDHSFRAVNFQCGRIVVRVQLSKGYVQAWKLHERQKLKVATPYDQSEVREDTEEFMGALRSEPEWVSTFSYAAFCEAKSYVQGGTSPPDRMVVHSKTGNFLHLVATVLTDAMGKPDIYNKVRELLQAQHFKDLLEMLRDAGASEIRYWIEMFAIDPRILQEDEGSGAWHARLLACLPTVMRSLRYASCQKKVQNIKNGRVLVQEGPLTQLLILDRNFNLVHEASSLSEMMLAKAMRVRQRLVLHPAHLKGGDLGGELKHLAKELGSAFSAQKLPWTLPYLEDRQAVYDTVRDLAIAGVKQHRADHESTWQELNMTNVYAVVGAAGGQRGSAQSRQSTTCGADDIGTMGDDAGADGMD